MQDQREQPRARVRDRDGRRSVHPARGARDPQEILAPPPLSRPRRAHVRRMGLPMILTKLSAIAMSRNEPVVCRHGPECDAKWRLAPAWIERAPPLAAPRG